MLEKNILTIYMIEFQYYLYLPAFLQYNNNISAMNIRACN